jgi:trans-2,3-dihydro-3-hydroxyanthranilate isomerase
MEHRFHTLDVFTTNRFEGNPLAVITDGDGLSNNTMQAIAREMNLAETVFVQKPTDDRALARLRIFTTKEELKLAGHPVVGTWFLLAELGVVPAQEGGVHIMQQTGAGILPVEIRFKNGRPQRVTMTQTPATFRPVKVNKKQLASALGIKIADFHPQLDPQYVSSGVYNLMVPLRNRAALARIEMNMNELRRLQDKNGTMARRHRLSRRLPRRVPRPPPQARARSNIFHSSGSRNGQAQPHRSRSLPKRQKTSPTRQRRGRPSLRRHHPHLTL